MTSPDTPNPSNKPHDDWTNEQLVELATRIALSAGELIREGLNRPRVLDTKSSGTDLVTEMDKAAEELIVSMIHAERPDDGLLGEEGTSQPGSSGVRWVIDPIDGTTNYVYRHPFFSVSIGVERNGVTVAGAVAIPMLNEIYTATLHGGAFRNGERIGVSSETAVSKALVGTGFAYMPQFRAIQGERVSRLLPQIREIRRGGSAAIDLCFVADGRLDAYYEDGLNPWDECAGLLIAQEAGARFARIPLNREVLVVGCPGTFDQLIALLSASGA
jgi:myo-inositol-1(or 4)-monophosphatase